MTPFIIICAVMVLAATALVVYPLVRPVPSTVKGQPLVPPATLPALMLAVALTIGAAAMYHHSSNFPWDNPHATDAAPPGHGDGTADGSMEQVTAQLEARLKDKPDDAEGWRMLARTYVISGKATEAVGAYEKALAILGDRDPGLKLDLAEALVLTDDPASQSRAKQIIDAVLAADATNQKALWYSGVLAYRANDKETAKTRWQKLLELNPPEEIRQILTRQLTEMGAAVPAAAETTPDAGAAPAAAAAAQGPEAASPAPQGRTIRVAVALDPSLAARLRPGTTLFVSARQPGIPGPPLAAVRLTTDALPTTAVLSDANSMIEGRNLSSVDDVEVVAHVAFGGTPMIASGDLVGAAVQKKGGPENLSVTITKVQP